MNEIKVLDHGYVRFIEAYGHGLAGTQYQTYREGDDNEVGIIEAARQSVGGGFESWEPYEGHPKGDAGLLNYLYNNKHCYDDQTEVLVRYKGFVNWTDVSPKDELGCFDPTTDSLVYETPKELIREKYNGEMYRINHGGVDLSVTPNHQMLVKTIVRVETNKQGWSDVWKLIPADELGDRSMVRYRKHVIRRKAPELDLSMFPAHDNSRDLLRLIGFFLGDGFAARKESTERNSINFHLKKKRKIDWLLEVCLGLGWEVREKSSFVVRAPGATKIFRSMFYDKNGAKYIPEFLLDLEIEDAKAVLDGLRNSDGAKHRGTWVYSTTSFQLANAVQLIALHAGLAAHINVTPKPKKSKHKQSYRVMILSRMREPVINQGKKNTSREKYKGMIYCAHTRTGILVVRRNGKIVLSGNSTPFEMAGLILEIKAPIFVFREWHRHRTQSYNEMSARYTPLPNENYIPTVERLMMNSKTNKQAGTIKGAEELTEEKAEYYRRRLYQAYEQDQFLYDLSLDMGIPKELARIHLPVGRYSQMRAAANLRNWCAFLTLRMAPNAQWEIRMYAYAVGEFIKANFPRTWELFALDMIGSSR